MFASYGTHAMNYDKLRKKLGYVVQIRINVMLNLPDMVTVTSC